jgi:hypothetical protein
MQKESKKQQALSLATVVDSGHQPEFQAPKSLDQVMAG